MAVKQDLHSIELLKYTAESGAQFHHLPLSYQLFGKPLGTAPVVLINHALTGNSEVAGASGWWSALVCPKGLLIQKGFLYSVLTFQVMDMTVLSSKTTKI